MEPSSGLYDPAIFENDDIKNENSDWIEIYNSGTSSVDLGSWSLSDNENIPDKWKFPEGTIILPDSYLVVLADELSEVIQSKHLHTNFKLSGDGEFLGLFDKDGNSRSAFNKKYPKQYNFYSYGISTDSGEEVYFSRPTPGSRNSGPSFSDGPKIHH